MLGNQWRQPISANQHRKCSKVSLMSRQDSAPVPTLGEECFRLRRRNSLKQKQLAHLAGVNVGTLISLEADRSIGLKGAMAIFNALGYELVLQPRRES